MHDGLDLVLAQEQDHRLVIADVRLDERQTAARLGLEGLHRRFVPSVQVVHAQNAMPVTQEPLHGVRTDVPGSSSDHHVHAIPP